MGQGRHSTILALVMLAAACHRAPSAGAVDPKPIQTGVASFYRPSLAGQKTANGETLKLNEMTAASRTLPLGSHVKVTNEQTGQSAKVRINDRGPYVQGRVIDLTPAAAQRVGIEREKGVAPVSIRPAPDATVADPAR